MGTEDSTANPNRRSPVAETVQDKLVRSEERFRLLVEGVRDAALYIVDPQGFVTTWNPGAERIKGYTAAEILGRHFSCFYTPEEIASGRPMWVLERAAREGKFEEEHIRVRKDGSRFWANVLVTPLYDDSGKLYGYAKVVRDVSARKAEDDKFKSLLESAPDAMVIIDSEGKINLINTHTEKLFGYSRDQLIGKTIETLVPEGLFPRGKDHQILPNKAEMRIISAGKELYAVRKDGSEFPIEVSLSPIETPEGLLVSSAIRDITDRRAAERLMREKERLAILGTTAAVFAHEIGNPLNSLATSLDLVKYLLGKRKDVDAVVLETLQAAAQEVERLSSLLKEYRSFARPRQLSLQPTDVGSLLRETIAPHRNSYQAAGIEVRFELGSKLPLISVDPEKMKQVILNLSKNAVEAMPGGGVLTCKAYSSDGQVSIEIRDTGIGIPEGTDVFQLFKTTKEDGTGLGLSIAQQIVSEHHGTIGFTSRQDTGTTFTIKLPCEAPA
jgi:two-component system sensor kinase FixL